METVRTFTGIPVRVLGITKGLCRKCWREVKGVNGRYRCPYCGNLGSF